MTHPVFAPGNVAVVTGGAAGIGLASARRFAGFGMKVVLADLGKEKLAVAAEAVRAAGAADVLVAGCDVSDRVEVEALKARVDNAFGGADLVMNNAAIQPGSTLFGSPETWARILKVNLWGVIHGAQVFAPGLIGRGKPGAIVNTGSKQGITSPPGDPAYNVAKSAVKTFSELLAHEIREADPQVSAHLLIPGFTFTDLTRRDRVKKPAGAWEPGQVAGALIEGMTAGDFYILCPDNEVSPEMDAKRMEWAMGDIIENRPPLSRWHPDWGDAFAEFAKDD